ncbi:MAG: NAD(P)/FAD-dependent oxidoreductase [Rhodothermales bacterium]|nr:NAD(P)/FAD-dependent oxidoreductase [Rhodothermales bacterium]
MRIVIVGNGITGVTAARHVRKAADHSITIISGETDFHFARTALMYIYMGDLRYEDTKPYADEFWARNGLELVLGHAVRVDTAARCVVLASGERVSYDRLLLATGSVPNRFGWEGEYAEGVQGLYSLQDLERMEASTTDVTSAVVVGGGLIGVEMAEMLATRGIDVTFVVREQRYMEYLLAPDESSLVESAIRAHGVTLELGAELKRIEVDEAGRACATHLTDGRRIEGSFVGLAVGVRPRIDLAKASGIESGLGILVDDHFRTSTENVFAAGDCAEFRKPFPGRKPVEQLWYTGRSQGRQVAAGLLGSPQAYEPPLFFNSAKFFDLEYQTYGIVPAAVSEGQQEQFWTDGERSIRIVYRSADQVVLGVNAFGIRLRQNVWSHWLRNGATLDRVLAGFDQCLFDPEFTLRMEVAA